MSERTVDVAVIGAGTAGLVAVREIRKQTENVCLIQDGPYGTTCARVGCMPSKALIQIAHDYHRRTQFDRQGIRGSEHLRLDLPHVMRRVRELRDRFTEGMVRRTDRLGERLLLGRARFLEPTVLEVDGQIVRARAIVLATGSRPVVPEDWRRFGERIWTSDTFFEQETLPSSVAVVGLGVVGLELGQAMARLGIEVLGIARSRRLGGISDPVVLETAAEVLGREMELWREVQVDLHEAPSGVLLSAGTRSRTVDAVLVAAGRRPNVEDLGLERLGTPMRKDGVPEYNPETLQVGRLPLFIAGDVNTARPILHEAWDDGRIAGHNAVAQHPASFARRTPLQIVFSDPNIAIAGQRYAELDAGTILIGEERFEEQGRAIIRGEAVGVARVYAQRETGRLLGGEFFAPDGEHLGHLLAWCIQQGLSVNDALKLPFYHPVIEEGLRAALEQAVRSR